LNEVMNRFNVEDIDIFKGLKAKTLEGLQKKARVAEYKKGDYLFFNKDKIDEVYFIVSGKVTLYRYTQKCQKRIIYILGEQEFINEVIFDNLPSSINAEAFEKTVVVKYNVEDFREMMAGDFHLAERIINSLGRKVRRLYRQIKNTVPISLDRKVAAKLWKLSRDYGVPSGDESGGCEESDWYYIDLKITITYLADMLGSSREAISREMKKLENIKMIKWSGRKLYVKKQGLSDYFKKE